MTKKKIDHCEKHPKVILITDNPDECIGVSDIIKSQVEAFRVVISPSDIYQVLIDSKPKVVCFGYLHLNKNVESYAELIEKGLFNYEHKAIVLCDNKESGAAFRCCIKLIFHDYFIHKPMYENFRLRLILNKNILQNDNDEKINIIQESHFGHLEDNIIKLIDNVAHQHSELIESLEKNKRIDLLENIKSTRPGNNQLDRETLEILREEYLDPLITTLESQLSHNIVHILEELKKNKDDVRNLSSELGVLVNSQIEQKEAAISRYIKQSRENSETILPENTSIRSSVKKIMVVDDNQLYREMICKVLREEGYHAEGYESGIDAINAIQSQTYSAIFMDLFMPGLDGLNATKNIRDISGCENLPIIALTSNKDKEVIRKWATYGLIGYIAKPATKTAIISALLKAQVSPN